MDDVQPPEVSRWTMLGGLAVTAAMLGEPFSGSLALAWVAAARSGLPHQVMRSVTGPWAVTPAGDASLPQPATSTASSAPAANAANGDGR